MTDLRSHADDPRFEAADSVATPAVARDLVVKVSDEAKLPFLGQELRDAPIKVHVDAVLIVGVRIFEVVSEAERGRELVPGLLIEIAVGTADVDRPVTDTKIGQTVWIVGPDRNVAGDVDHVIVDALVPPQRDHRNQVGETPRRVGAAATDREAGASERARQCSTNGCLLAAVPP